VDEVRLRPADWPAALEDCDGRRIVVAGPGTGKTEFLVRQVGAIIQSGRASPAEIIVLSFSRRSSARLKQRIEEAVGATGVPVDVGTFHSLALRLIESVTGGDRPIPLTTPEQVGLVRQTLREEDPADWPVLYRDILDSAIFSAEVADFFLRCSERLLTPRDLAQRAVERSDWRGLAGLFERYLSRLEKMGRTDYGVLLTKAVELLRSDDGRRHTSRFRYVLVDEYQDTSPAQATIAELLATAHGNLTVAGDPYQSIFSFRGAEVRNIAAFSDDASSRRIVLAQSFRVPAPIMESALRVVSAGDLPGSAGPVEPAPHDGVSETYVFDQETAEAEWIAREVEHLIRTERMSPSAIAVLVRSKKELISELSRALGRRGLPHDPPDNRLVDHPAVRVIQDLVTVGLAEQAPPGGLSPLEAVGADQAMRRMLLGPLFVVSVGQEREMLRSRRKEARAWADVISEQLPGKDGFRHLVSDAGWATELGASEGFWDVWTRLDGIADVVADPGRAEWRRAWAAFGQMLTRQTERDPSVTLARFFEMVDEDDFEATPLISIRPSSDRITLTTLHQAKGLEFEVVFIANAVEGVFPDLRRSRRMLRPELLSPERTVDPDAQHLFQIQEEMRLAYTAMTRARRRVVWTATEAGIDQGDRRPSRFLMAAAGDAGVGPPTVKDRAPVTLTDAESALRRSLLDPGAGSAHRLASAAVLGSPPKPWWDAGAFPGAVVAGPDTPVLAEVFRLSPSQADSYQRCPRRYVLERRLRLGDAASVWAHFGELAHEILEIAESEVIGTGRRHADLARVLEIVDQVWEKADFGPRELTNAWKVKAVEMLTKLYERWPGKGDPVEVELGVEADVEGVGWMGRIDRLEQTVEGFRVVDYKTSATAPSLDEAAQSIQLGFYALAVQRQGRDVVASEMWFPRVSSKSVITRKLATHLLPDVERTISEVTRAIASEDWAPRVSNHCKRCDFRRSCPAWPEGRGAFLP